MAKIFSDIHGFDDEDNEENDSSGSSKKYQSKTSALLFLVDARKKMFSTAFTGEKTGLMSTLECLRKTIRNKIFNEEKCYCSIILLGTKETENALKLNNITVVQELNLLGTEHIQKIDEITKDIENGLYEKKYGFGNFSLGDAFWLSTHTFNEKSQQLNKSILLFTNDDNCVTDQKNDYNRAVTSAKDMKKNNIILDVIQLGENFDTDKFYSKILKASQEEGNYTNPEPVTSLEEMERRAGKVSLKHVTMTKLPFVISDDFTIGVSLHFLVKKLKIPFKVKLSKATNERVFTKMQMFETETGSVVDGENTIKSECVGQKNINFTMKELKSISDNGNVELRLMGFKPASVISLENFVKPCAFIYPDESKYKGSSTFFTALLRRCTAKQVVAICTLCMRTTSACRFVALIAQCEKFNSSIPSELPEGFVVFFLPFAEEIRPFDDMVTATSRAFPEQIDIAIRLIKKLKFKYKVNCFQNPKMRNHWAAIEALALDLPEPEAVNDTTYPNYELISARTGKIAEEFTEAVYYEDYDPEVAGAPKKRRTTASTSGSHVDCDDVERVIRAGMGQTLTNEALKNYLKSVGDGKSLWKVKKSDLLKRAEKYLNLD